MIHYNKQNYQHNYIGQTGRILKNRILEQRGYISKDDTSKATGGHFNLPGHRLSDFTMTILEQVQNNEQMYREEIEHYYIRKFNTYYRGLNIQILRGYGGGFLFVLTLSLF